MLSVQFDILRRDRGAERPYHESVAYSTEDENMTVAKALSEINARSDIKPIRWECSCMQKKCGACAMVINGVPRLACDAKLKELGKKIRLEPLRKFPVVADLFVDRSIMFENLRAAKAWLEAAEPKSADEAYEASRCLQCGCCLEVCPNFYEGGKFFGMASMVPLSRLIAETDERELYRQYEKHFYSGCGKSLACRKICPAGIDVDKLLVNSNAAAVWKALIGKLKYKHIDRRISE